MTSQAANTTPSGQEAIPPHVQLLLGLIYPATARGNQTRSGALQQGKHQGADEWLLPTTAQVPIFTALACSLMSCTAELTEA